MSYREPAPGQPAEIIATPPRAIVAPRLTETVKVLLATAHADAAAWVFYGAFMCGTPVAAIAQQAARNIEDFERLMDERTEQLRRTEEHIRRIERELKQSRQ